MPATSREQRRAGKQTGQSSGKQMDAIDLLENDHREVEAWFDEFEDCEDDERKQELAEMICLALRHHTIIEEEILYPEARQALGDDEMLDEAKVEHDAAKALIEEIEAMEVGDDMFDAKIKVLSEQIEHHVEEEEEEMFPALRETELDLDAMGARLAARKEELTLQA